MCSLTILYLIYVISVLQSPKVLELLKMYESRLGKFCYSIYTLDPKAFLCKVSSNERINELRGQGIYSMSDSKAPVLKDMDKFIEIKTNFTAFNVQENRDMGRNQKRYIKKKTMNLTEALARNDAGMYCAIAHFFLMLYFSTL